MSVYVCACVYFCLCMRETKDNEHEIESESEQRTILHTIIEPSTPFKKSTYQKEICLDEYET